MCEICRRIELIKQNNNPCFVMETKTGYVVLGDTQYFKGYALFLYKGCVRELHDIDLCERIEHLKELSIISEGIYNVFHGEKMNIESLGNGDAHLHWHLFPRKENDMPIKGPVWWLPKEEMYHEKHFIKSEFIEEYSPLLEKEINKLLWGSV